MKKWQMWGLGILLIIGALGTDLGLGYWDVFYTKTVEKAQINADREVFEGSQSYVESKRQIASKLYREFNRETDLATKTFIANSVANEFANVKESDVIVDPVISTWITNCKRGTTTSGSVGSPFKNSK